MKKSVIWLALLAASVSGLARADDAAIQQSLKKLGIQQAQIQASPVAGLKTVFSEGGVLYVTDDGKHILQGPMYDVSGAVPENVTNQLLMKRLDKLAPEMIVYKAPKQKYVITVFTDITCGYCHKLHSQIKEYNDLGITVRYLAFPRQGPDSKAEKDMQSIWCMADRRKAFDDALKGETISPATCDVNIKSHYALGVQFGIQGTPAIVLSNGMVIPGYQGPKEMLAMLDAQAQMSQKKG
ncbi:bifunctional protein-disulfide isomerase/oxidoreductase DsbC [Edwardsiella ictaluri]|uniref:Thiol:disulfide interchange protein n=2 Tax=Edwardsiella ictaluri TaxID=67780 RepID=C5BAS0_EDWI9|nr:bifunctional protein-disulfide isomerase/oxidoreductase DsbC [Edwardsiella ictaluri]ACR70479.1 thiol:disulfide interchange protein DsbC, putative [Edwardsiella ictaluri 93-146]AVZ82693.1 bifunctional protein-disulfide isomerase/oxidoreductase DsbC [Edwardsiella ictaluri]EKS7761593.1 bifunctional protein-disulfide isomerase/oxidoreductase DsbC [Edwardsiella ictaluri]EKS7769370.1 bifunctional protein-disulfide isomerase/oxidoreductase DsbC [Edwardsiella ictaluri]EKS7772519.1 bifunctional prot